MAFQTVFEFTLPRGCIDSAGVLHCNGQMRLATALDEIEALMHPQVQAQPAYLPVVLLSRVVTRLGSLPEVTPADIANLFSADLAYLEDLYQRINAHASVLVDAVCPHCSRAFRMQVAPLEEQAAEPAQAPGSGYEGLL